MDLSPVVPVVQLQVVLGLLNLLEQSFVIARMNLTSASITHPMYGIVQSVRGTFQSVMDR